MKKPFKYSALMLSESLQVIEDCEVILESVDITFHKVSTSFDGLDYLMDFETDIIILDLSINKIETFQFLHYISSDSENQFTPIIFIVDTSDFDAQEEDLSQFNIISIMCIKSWRFQANKLLNYLRLTKLNLHLIQGDLLESNTRGVIDPLTGAYNRYGCEDIFHTLSSRHKAYNEQFSAIMVDIDHFKNVNDTHGHDIGDDVLREFTRILMCTIRREDSVIRLGGEEFLIFLSNANALIASKSAETIRKKIESSFFSHKKIKITASFGVTQYQDSQEMDLLLKKVDTLLYHAKNSGRNKVVSA